MRSEIMIRKGITIGTGSAMGRGQDALTSAPTACDRASMALTPLTIHLFGPLRVTVRGEPLPRVRTRSVEWLLALLVLRHGRAVNRSWLAGTLWPESDQSRALQSLRDDLLRLRKALGPEGGRIQSPTTHALTIDLSGADVDVCRFDAGIQVGHEEALRSAVADYRGPLLEGCVEEWVLAERETRAEQCLAALEVLAERAAGRNDQREAIGYLRRAAVLDPHRDALQRRLMTSLAAEGDPAAAMQVYHDFRNRLQEELVSVPDEATTRLFHEIRAAARRGAAGVRAFGRSGLLVTTDAGAQKAWGTGAGQRQEAGQPTTDDPTGSDTDGGGRSGVVGRQAQPECLSARPPDRPDAVLHRPPRPLTPLIGREREVTEVSERLRQGRLVTLIGGGGVGKTRLALEVADRVRDEFPGGALWVELAPVADGALLLPSVAAALGIYEETAEPLPSLGNRQAPGGEAEPIAAPRDAGSLEARLVARLSDNAPLLALDNCEHLLDAAAQTVQTLLQQCPDLRVLVTSRQRLGLAGEVAWRVPSLPVPDPQEWPVGPAEAVEHAMAFPAVRLFVERAAAVREGFGLSGRTDAVAVGQICSRLDGIALAIELAAARVRVLTPQQIVERLDDRFHLLTTGARGALPRHQTLRALIDWSYDQLPDAEATLLRRLAVFAGGWTLEAACACGTSGERSALRVENEASASTLKAERSPLPDEEWQVLDLLDSLVDRSLVLAEASGGELRYRVLETVREYALERLREHGEEDVARARHLAYFLSLAETAGVGLRGPDPAAALALLGGEIDNFRAALTWVQSAKAPADAALRLGAALWPFWQTRGYLSEGRHHLRAALQRSSLYDAPERGQALLGAAHLAFHQGDLDEADTFAQESREWFRSRGDARGMAAALFCLGEAALHRGEVTAGASRFAEMLEASRKSGWSQGIALALLKLGGVAPMLGESARARASLEEGRLLAEALGDAPMLALALYELARLAEEEGDDARAGPLLEQNLEIWRRLGNKRSIAETLSRLGSMAARRGDRTRATSLLEEAAATCRELGNRRGLVWSLIQLGNVHYTGGAYATARAEYEQSLRMFRELGDAHGTACASNNLGMTWFHLGDPARAQALHREALVLYQGAEHPGGVVWSLERLGIVAARCCVPQQAARLLGAASAARAKLVQAWSAGEASDLEQATTVLRETLGPEAWEAAWQAGRAMGREEAIAFALDDAGT